MYRNLLKRAGLILWLAALVPTTGFAQVEEEWVRRYDGANFPDQAVDVEVDAAGNVYVAGNSEIFEEFDEIAILKYNANGNFQWSRHYGLPEKSHIAIAMAVDPAGNIYVTGRVRGEGLDIVTLMYDTNGNRLWVKYYAGAADPGIFFGPNDEPAGIAVDSKGNVCVVGRSEQNDSDTELLAIKYDAAGNELWIAKHRVENVYYAYAADLAVDVFDNVYLAGSVQFNNSTSDFLTIKYDAAGRLRWLKSYDGNYHDNAQAIAVDAAANVYVTGISVSDKDSLETVKYDSTGALLWRRIQNGNVVNTGEPFSVIAVDAEQNVFVTGTAVSSVDVLGADFRTVKYDADGIVQWVRTYNSPGNGYDYDVAIRLIVDGFGNVYVLGSGGNDFATVKYSNAGSELWVMRYNGPANQTDHPSDIAIDANGNIYVTGDDIGVTGTDFATIKYSQTTLPAPVTFRPTDDAYVEAANPTSNFGTRLTLRVREASTNAEQSYLKFNVSGLTGQVQSAKLRLYVTDASSDGGNLYSVSNDYQGTATPWTQSGLNWNNAPSIAGVALRFLGPISLNTWVEMDVTSAITGNGVYSFGIKNSSSDVVYYSSKEGSNPPELLIRTLGDVPLPTGFCDTFDDGSADGWSPLTSSRWTVTQYQNASAYSLRTAGNPPAEGRLGEYSVFDGFSAKDFTFECRARSAEDFAVEPRPDIALLYEYLNDLNYSYAVFHKESASTNISKVVDGVRTKLVTSDGTIEVLQDSAYHDFKVSRSNGEIKVYYDGSLVMSAIAPNPVSGKLGLGSLNDRAYFDKVSVNDACLARPDLIITSVQAPASASAGDSIAITFAVKNQGDATTGVFRVGIYLSADNVVDPTDRLLGSHTITGLSAGASAATTTKVTISVDAASGSYNLGIYVDDLLQIEENDETNNTGSLPFTIPTPPANLKIYTGAMADNGYSYDAATHELTIRTSIENNGGSATGNFRLGYYLSADATIDTSDYLVASSAQDSLSVGSFRKQSRTVDLDSLISVVPDTYYVGAYLDDQFQISETNESDNTISYTPAIVYTGNVLAGKIYPISPPTVSSSLNTEFDVLIEVAEVINLFGLTFELSFDSTYLHAVSETAEPFIGSDVVFLGRHANDSGKVSIAVSRKSGQGGVSGTGNVARIRFKVVQSVAQDTTINFVLAAVSANDSSGAPIELQAESNSTKLETGLTVWPGDTDNNGIVNQADVLPVGLHWQQSGPPRAVIGCGFSGQPATPWTIPNATYADANGNGIVNQAEVLCIGLNWQKMHSASQPVVAAKTLLFKTTAATPPLKAVLSDPQTADNEADVVIVVGDSANPVVNLFGVSFVVRYDPQQLRVVSVLQGDFLGANLPIWFTHVDSTAGKISIGMSRAGVPQGMSGAGALAMIRMRTATSANIGSVTQIVIEEVAANDPSGNPIELVAQGTDIVVAINHHAEIPAQYALMQNYPNPFNPETVIEFALPQPGHVKLEVYNVLGQRIRTLINERVEAGVKTIKWNGRNDAGQQVPSGVYLYRMEAGSFFATRKLVLMR